MARSGFDFGSINSVFAVNQMDTAEIVNILMGFSSVDGFGRTIFIDNFRYGLGAWLKIISGGGSNPRLIDKNYFDGGAIFIPPYAVYMLAGNVVNAVSELSKVFYLTEEARVGMEIGFLLASGACDVELRIAHEDINGVAKNVGARISVFTGLLYVLDNTGWVSIGSFDIPTGTSYFNVQAKIVADFDTNKYVRFYFGDRKFDISAYSLADTVININGYTNFTVVARSKGAGFADVYLGMVRCTKDEP